MSDALKKLVSNASAPLDTRPPSMGSGLRDLAGAMADPLLDMLGLKNGFYAFESALHVLPSHSNEYEFGLDEWNSDALWRHEYGEMADGCLFFAEDVFGGQFCLKDDAIYSFDPETAGLEFLAVDINGWAAAVIADFEFLTGYPLAHHWQIQHGKLPAQKRLMPKVPFVAGGEFTLDNLCLVEAVDAMKLRASFAKQVESSPDGSQIQFKLVD